MASSRYISSSLSLSLWKAISGWVSAFTEQRSFFQALLNDLVGFLVLGLLPVGILVWIPNSVQMDSIRRSSVVLLVVDSGAVISRGGWEEGGKLVGGGRISFARLCCGAGAW